MEERKTGANALATDRKAMVRALSPLKMMDITQELSSPRMWVALEPPYLRTRVVPSTIFSCFGLAT